MITSTERLVDTNGVQLRVTEAGDRGAPAVLLAHGFPDLAYGWRHQISALADAGYHVLAPDQRGYGGSTRPDAVEDYNIVSLSGDLIGLLDDVGADRAVFVGHDWGANVVWFTGLQHPDRVAGVVGVSVPPIPRPRVPPTQAFRKIFGDNFFYMLYFQEPGVADAELARHPATTLRRLLSGGMASGDQGAGLRMLRPGPEGFIERLTEPGTLPDWMSQDEFDHYVEEFSRNGFTGPLNWYRNLDRNWELTKTTPAASITVPSMLIAGSADPILAFTARNRYAEVVSGDYREVMLDGAGHWIQQQLPDEVNEALLDYLSRLELI